MSHSNDSADTARFASSPAGALIATTLALAAIFAPAHASAQPHARSARSMSGTDTAHLHLVHSGERLLEEGAAGGVLPGRMRAELNIGPTYTGSFTIYTRNGQISGSGSATPHGAGRYQSFAGELTVTGGTGRYAHARGRERLYGVFDRRSYAVLVKTSGPLSY